MIFSHDILKKRILITGANGLLGERLLHFFSFIPNVHVLACGLEESCSYRGVDYYSCDLTQRDDVKKIIYDYFPDIIVNTAAYTNVDKSETERESAWKVNVKAVEYLSESARVIDAHLIHVSTDYVFDGTNGPYTEIDKPNPLGYYGRTKLASENALKISGCNYAIVRTNVLYGISKQRPDFVRWVVNSLSENKKINIVVDQINNPTFTDDLAQGINLIAEKRKFGTYNIGGREILSRFEFTEQIAEVFRLDKSLINPILTEDLNQPARRPLKSGLLILKAESELGYKPTPLIDALNIIKEVF